MYQECANPSSADGEYTSTMGFMSPEFAYFTHVHEFMPSNALASSVMSSYLANAHFEFPLDTANESECFS